MLLDAIMEFFAEDCVMDLPRGPNPWGTHLGPERRRPRAGCASRFAGLPDAHYGDDRHWLSGDMGFSEWLLDWNYPRG